MNKNTKKWGMKEESKPIIHLWCGGCDMENYIWVMGLYVVFRKRFIVLWRCRVLMLGFSRLGLFFAVFLVFSMGAVNANPSLADGQSSADYIYNDNKFNFEFTPIKNSTGFFTSYNVTVSRKDTTFDKYPVQFIYQVFVVDASHKIKLETKYVYLEAGKDKVSETETLNPKEKLEGLQSGNYGIKFPITNYSTYKDSDLSIRDALFNLDLKYNYEWIRKSGFDYKFTTRNNVALNCPVTLKRAITIHFKDIPSYTEWFTFKLNTGSITQKDFKNFNHELTSYHTSADEYYLQFQ